jgi:hypothetical protein
VFEDIHVVRVVGRDCHDIKKPQATATQIVWATIRSHTVMEEYSRRNFFEHPSISAVIARHLASHHTRPDSAVTERINRLENTLTTLARKADNIESRLSTLELKFNAQAEALAEVIKNEYSPLKKPRGERGSKGGQISRRQQGSREVMLHTTPRTPGEVAQLPASTTQAIVTT